MDDDDKDNDDIENDYMDDDGGGLAGDDGGYLLEVDLDRGEVLCRVERVHAAV